MQPDDSSEFATPSAGKVAPEAMALRAQPRPVTRLNRRTLAILTGGLSVAVLGATIWSLQPHRHGAGGQTELYNVDRVSKSERLDGLPSDYSKLPAKVPTARLLPPGRSRWRALRNVSPSASSYRCSTTSISVTASNWRPWSSNSSRE